MLLSVEAAFCSAEEGILAVDSFLSRRKTMSILAAIVGIVVILLVAQDAFETIVLPRRVTRRIASPDSSIA